MVSPADRSRKASVHRFLISGPDLRIDAAPSLLQLRTARLQHHRCSKRVCPACRMTMADAGGDRMPRRRHNPKLKATGVAPCPRRCPWSDSGPIIPPIPVVRPLCNLPAASRGHPRAHSPAAMVSGFDSCRGKLRDTPKIFTFALSLPLPDGQERRKHRKHRKHRKRRKYRKHWKRRKHRNERRKRRKHWKDRKNRKA